MPCVDIFATVSEFIIHFSLPGARKADISVTYDPERTTLQVVGVVLRPGIDEKAFSALVADEKGEEEIGVFEREIQPANLTGLIASDVAVVDVNDITAWLTDGVLIVTLPRVTALPLPKMTVIVQDRPPYEQPLDGAQSMDDGNHGVLPTASGDFDDKGNYIYVDIEKGCGL